MEKRKTHKGRLRIVRLSGNMDPPHSIGIALIDGASGTTAFEIEMSLEDFALCVTSMEREVEFEGPSPYFLKHHEYRTERIPAEVTRGIIAADLPVRLAPYEVDGWIARREDLENHHRLRSDGTIEVGFDRWVEGEGD